MATLPPYGHARPTSPGRVPVTLLTGFLGAGKTTLLNRLMARPEMATAAVFINELGEIGIDHHLVERIDDALVILDSGCLCCTVQGDLIVELKRLHDRMARREIPPVSRVVIETTGIADPIPVVRALMEDRFVAPRFRCDGIVTVVDAVHAAGQLPRHREARVQVSSADRIVISKGDLCDSADRAALSGLLAALNPAAPRLGAREAAEGPGLLFGGGLYSEEAAPANPNAWLGTGPASATAAPTAQVASFGTLPGPRPLVPVHSGRVRSFAVPLTRPVPWRGFAIRIGEILERWRGTLLRLKGIVPVLGVDVPAAIQCVEAAAYTPVWLPAWPSVGPMPTGHGALVVIGEDLSAEDEAGIRAHLDDFPADRLALRQVAVRPALATRAWFNERVSFTPPPELASEAFVIRPRFLATSRTTP